VNRRTRLPGAQRVCNNWARGFPGVRSQDSQTKLSHVDAVLFRARRSPDRIQRRVLPVTNHWFVGTVRARLDSTQTHFENRESPSGKFVDLMLLMDVVTLVFMFMVFMFFMCVVCVSFTGVITLASVSIMLEVITAFELRFGDGSHLCQMREGPGKQPCGYMSVQVAAAFLDEFNLPCNFLSPTQEPEGWNVLRNMLINLINEDCVSVIGVASGAGGPGEETHGSPDAPP
jgi:hypothetical protein